MGPVKLLGLSHAHGQVSSFAVMRLMFRTRSSVCGNNGGVLLSDISTPTDNPMFGVSVSHDSNSLSWENDSIASAVSASTHASACAPSPLSASSHHVIKKQVGGQQAAAATTTHAYSTIHTKIYKSTVVKSNSNPTWPMVQSESNTSMFNISLEKGIMPRDGMEIYLSIQMKEEWSAVDSIVPVKSGGDGMLGEAEINLTPLVLRGFNIGALNVTDTEEIDVLDEWAYLCPPPSRNVEKSFETGNEQYSAGKVRLIISYEPNGFTPRRGDIVALEAFARQSISTSSYRPVIHPSHPLRVRDVRGEYLLCVFDLPPCHDGNRHLISSNGHSHRNKVATMEGSIRLHRNAVFVIERTNFIDSAINVALKPADAVLSTPIGKDVTESFSPYVEAVGKFMDGCFVVLLVPNNMIFDGSCFRCTLHFTK